MSSGDLNYLDCSTKVLQKHQHTLELVESNSHIVETNIQEVQNKSLVFSMVRD